MVKRLSVLALCLLLATLSAAQAVEITYPLTQEAVTLTALVPLNPTAIAPEEMETFQYLTKTSGIELALTTVASSAYGEKRNLMVASGDLTDLIFGSFDPSSIMTYLEQDALYPIGGLIEEGYAPHFSAVLEQRPEYYAALMAPDGEVYGFPYIEEMYGLVLNRGILYINQAWLTALGLEVPKTLDEFEAALLAFRDNDCNGNGDATDEIPFMFRMGSSSVNSTRNSQSIGQFFACFGQADTSSRMAVDAQGKIIWTADTPAYKEGLQWFNGLWEQGLIDPEMPLNDGNAYNSKLREEPCRVGAFMIFVKSGSMTEERDADYVPVPYMTGPEGYEFGCRENLSEIKSIARAVVTTACEYPELAVSMIDLLYEPTASITCNWGPMGLYYQEDENGLMQWADTVPEGYDTLGDVRAALTLGAYGVPLAILNDYYDTLVAYPEDAQATYEDMQAVGFVEKHLHDTAIPQNLWYSAEDNERLSLIRSNIYNITDNYNATAIIDGNIDATWDAYLAELNAAGLPEMLEIVQRAYDAYAINLDKVKTMVYER